jgi:pantothenate kinase-related protein Tda10
MTADITRTRDGIEPLLRHAVEDRRLGGAELDALAAATGDDPVQPAFAPAGGTESARAAVLERIELVRCLWGPFAEWWHHYFAGSVSVPLTDLWRLYVPFGQWIVREKRKRRPGELFMVGFNGSPGAGKTVLTNALAVVLNHLLDPETEGQAVARAGDDWYLGKREREPLRAQGYDPGLPCVSNRGIPGTHDLDWLKRNLLEMERSTPRSTIRMGNFDKKTDDQPTGADRYFEVRGKVGVFLFDLWFAGARTDVDPLTVEDGLRRRVAEKLVEWRTLFDRMDALWGFNWPPFEQMLREREAQERLVERRRGAAGMSGESIRAFMTYMIERTWDWRATSPIPPDGAVTFRAWRDDNHRVIAVHKGGRAS